VNKGLASSISAFDFLERAKGLTAVDEIYCIKHKRHYLERAKGLTAVDEI